MAPRIDLNFLVCRDNKETSTLLVNNLLVKTPHINTLLIDNLWVMWVIMGYVVVKIDSIAADL